MNSVHQALLALPPMGQLISAISSVAQNNTFGHHSNPRLHSLTPTDAHPQIYPAYPDAQINSFSAFKHNSTTKVADGSNTDVWSTLQYSNDAYAPFYALNALRDDLFKKRDQIEQHSTNQENNVKNNEQNFTIFSTILNALKQLIPFLPYQENYAIKDCIDISTTYSPLLNDIMSNFNQYLDYSPQLPSLHQAQYDIQAIFSSPGPQQYQLNDVHLLDPNFVIDSREYNSTLNHVFNGGGVLPVQVMKKAPHSLPLHTKAYNVLPLTPILRDDLRILPLPQLHLRQTFQKLQNSGFGQQQDAAEYTKMFLETMNNELHSYTTRLSHLGQAISPNLLVNAQHSGVILKEEAQNGQSGQTSQTSQTSQNSFNMLANETCSCKQDLDWFLKKAKTTAKDNYLPNGVKSNPITTWPRSRMCRPVTLDILYTTVEQILQSVLMLVFSLVDGGLLTSSKPQQETAMSLINGYLGQVIPLTLQMITTLTHCFYANYILIDCFSFTPFNLSPQPANPTLPHTYNSHQTWTPNKDFFNQVIKRTDSMHTFIPCSYHLFRQSQALYTATPGSCGQTMFSRALASIYLVVNNHASALQQRLAKLFPKNNTFFQANSQLNNSNLEKENLDQKTISHLFTNLSLPLPPQIDYNNSLRYPVAITRSTTSAAASNIADQANDDEIVNDAGGWQDKGGKNQAKNKTNNDGKVGAKSSHFKKVEYKQNLSYKKVSIITELFQSQLRLSLSKPSTISLSKQPIFFCSIANAQ